MSTDWRLKPLNTCEDLHGGFRAILGRKVILLHKAPISARSYFFLFLFLYSANKLCKFFFNLHLFSGADQLKDQYTYILTRIESEVPIYIIPRDFKVLSFAQYKALK